MQKKKITTLSATFKRRLINFCKDSTKLTIILQHTETIEDISDSIKEAREKKLDNR